MLSYLKNHLLLIILLTVMWCILSEKISLVTIGAGLVISFFSLYILKIIQPYRNKNYSYSISFFTFILFLVVLIKDIYVSAFKTIMHLMNNQLNPQFVVTSTKIKRPWLQAIIGNAITLTPGTVTVHLSDGNFTVLWLYPSSIRQKEIKHQLVQNFETILMKEE